MIGTEPRPEDSRALALALALDRAGTHKALSSRLRALVGTENEGRMLAATRHAEAALALKMAQTAEHHAETALELKAPMKSPPAEDEVAEDADSRVMADKMRAMAEEMASGKGDPKAMADRMREMADRMTAMSGGKALPETDPEVGDGDAD